MEKAVPKTDKENLKDAIKAWGVANGTGNFILVQASAMVVEEHLKRLPDNFPPLEQPTPTEPTDETPPSQS